MAAVAALLTLVTACHSETPPLVAVADQPATPRRAEPVQAVVVDRTIALSPAADASLVDTAAASPEALCRAFLQRLQTGDRIGAEALMTREALKTTTKANLMLEPITDANSSVSVQTAVFEGQRHDVAEVECRIADRQDGQVFESKITWQVRKQAGGWRVSGMYVPLDADAPSQLLSFESIDDVATIKLLATGEAFEASLDPRQAEAQGTGTTLQ